MSAEYTNYNYDELWALHLAGDCPWDCPFCFDDEEDEQVDPWTESDSYEEFDAYDFEDRYEETDEG